MAIALDFIGKCKDCEHVDLQLETPDCCKSTWSVKCRYEKICNRVENMTVQRIQKQVEWQFGEPVVGLEGTCL